MHVYFRGICMCVACMTTCPVGTVQVFGVCLRVTAQLSPGLLLLFEPDALQALGAGDESDVPALFH